MNCARVYKELVARAQTRGALTGYSEIHHVVPRAHGGTDDPSNLVALTAREHFIAHWLLWCIHRDRSTALAFRLLCDRASRPRSRAYEAAKQCYSQAMLGEANVAKRPEVREKIRLALKEKHPCRGNKRPDHAALLRSRGHWSGANNPFHGQGANQTGARNHMARPIVGCHPEFGSRKWDTLSSAAMDLGVSLQAISQAIRKNNRSRGWQLEHAV